nr:immunoglobulin light chain junction region [Macaca mulatta]
DYSCSSYAGSNTFLF